MKYVLSPILFLFTFLLVVQDAIAQVQFIENKGQWDESVQYLAKMGDASFYLNENGFVVDQHHSGDMLAAKEKVHEVMEHSKKLLKDISGRIRSHAYKVEFLNAGNPSIVGEKPVATVNNYFIGDDPSKWAAGCKIYRVVQYRNIYPGIDIRYYVDGTNNLKYDFIVHPGADVSAIKMKYSGTDKLNVDKRELVVTTSLGENRSLRPYTYQVVDNQRQEVECNYMIRKNVVSFKVKNYNPAKTLIIDPTLIFFTYSGSTADNWGFTATYGYDGSFYGGGIVHGTGFPTSTGSYNENFNGGNYDIGIIKLTPNGNNRVYATYIGGDGLDQPHSLIEDRQGNLVLSGRSNSTNYPEIPANAPNTGPGGNWDIVVTKLNATGTALIGSLKIGGSGEDGVNVGERSTDGQGSLRRNYGDDSRSEVLLDNAGNIYVAACTVSSDFPIVGGVQASRGGGQDAVLLKINPSCSNILLSTYIGGTGDDAAYVLTIAGNGNIYVAGGTNSADLPGISPSGVIKPFFSQSGASNDDCDGFVLELNNAGNTILRGTYIGTGKADQVYGITQDKFGYIYIMGTSEGNMPVINATYFNQGSKQFIGKLEKDLSAYIYATVFGSTNATVPNISPTAFMVDQCENVYVSGWGGMANSGYNNGNVKGMPTTPNAIYRNSDATGSDFYFIVLEKNADSLLFGSFYGQTDAPAGSDHGISFGDHVDGGTSRFDKRGYIYQAICANCFRQVPFPGTPGTWSPSNQAVTGGSCNLGMIKIEMDFTGVSAGLQAFIKGVPDDTVGCIPLQVDFKDIYGEGKLYYWDFGDGNGDTTTTPYSSNIYVNTGQYQVRLIAIDSATCNIADTAYLTITAGDNRIDLDFNAIKIGPCTSNEYSFQNTSTAPNGNINNPNIFIWDFGDNTAPDTASYNSTITHTYAGPGTYPVTLRVIDPLFCNSPGDTIKLVRLSPEVKSMFTTPAKGCVPYNAEFENTSLGGLNFLWDFGDGTTSTDVAPTHLYALPGQYVITLIANDSTSCNQSDTSQFTITVYENPAAAFTWNPLQPEYNTTTDFVNKSVGAVSYLWNFGDGDTSNITHPSHIFPQTGTFNVCLQATNIAGCMDTVCAAVDALINPILDVPNAFTPGKPGLNSKIGVVGFGIQKMEWKIYNRWGQMVFESSSPDGKWDGTFQGAAQPTDVYTYTLKATLADGKKVTRTGDITLIR